jgi:hypothetical protein
MSPRAAGRRGNRSPEPALGRDRLADVVRAQHQIELVARLQDADPRTRWSYASEAMRDPASRYVDPAWF